MDSHPGFMWQYHNVGLSHPTFIFSEAKVVAEDGTDLPIGVQSLEKVRYTNGQVTLTVVRNHCKNWMRKGF